MRNPLLLIASAVFVFAAGSTAPAQNVFTTLRSRPSTGTSDGHSSQPSMSLDGSILAFVSTASNLVEDDNNNTADIFVYNDNNFTLTRISVASDGAEANGASASPAVAADGRFVAFSSVASNLVNDDTNNTEDIFVHDLLVGTTVRISISSDGFEGDGKSMDPAISADGQTVTFSSDAENLVENDNGGSRDVFVHEMLSGVTTRVSVHTNGTGGNHHSLLPRISGNGRYVAFQSTATNLVDSDTNAAADVFVHDTQTSVTTRVSVGNGNAEGTGASTDCDISIDGRHVVFVSAASNFTAGDTNNLPDIFLRDTIAGTTERVNVSSTGAQATVGVPSRPRVSMSAQYITFIAPDCGLVVNDVNLFRDVFVRDRTAGTTLLISVNNKKAQGNNEIGEYCADLTGARIAFSSDATNMDGDDLSANTDVFYSEHSKPPGGFDSVSLTLRRGKLTDPDKPDADTFSAEFTYIHNLFSPDNTWDPTAEAVTIGIGAGAPLSIQIPALDAGWKSTPKGRHTWRSPKGSLPRMTWIVDTSKKTITLRAGRLNLPQFTNLTIPIAIQIGNERGANGQQWELKKPSPLIMKYTAAP